jgi:flavin reductase (DIM6/NTAB) family NADH-FMN oxidoreductase RutF
MTQLATAIDDALFVQVMSAFAAGVAVVTTVDEDGVPRGLTTTAVTSVSRQPPLLLVCVDNGSRTLPAIRHSAAFVVNFIAAAHAELALQFASKAEDKFGAIDWRAGTNGAPVLHEHAHAWADCRVEQEIEAGDHVVFIAEVTHAGVADDEAEHLPLTYYRRSFGRFVAHADASSSA